MLRFSLCSARRLIYLVGLIIEAVSVSLFGQLSGSLLISGLWKNISTRASVSSLKSVASAKTAGPSH